jgi:hypothetical protein
MTDWRAWHASYDDASTSLARRLLVVRHRVSEVLASRAPSTSLRIASLCAGDGRDLLPGLAEIDAVTVQAVLIEQDAALAEAARASAEHLGLEGVSVIIGDAGSTTTLASALPVDLLLLCGIFGNVSEFDIATTVAATPVMLRPGGTVIWTRGSSEPDLRPVIRRWFQDAGLTEVAFDSEPNGFGVGVATLGVGAPRSPRLPARLFTFIR